MNATFWTHDTTVAAIVTVVGTVVTTVINVAVSSAKERKASRIQQLQDEADDDLAAARVAGENENAVRDMALKTWESIRASQQAEIEHLERRLLKCREDCNEKDAAILLLKATQARLSENPPGPEGPFHR